MSMTKKELADVENLKTRLALRLYPEVEPDVDIPTEWGEVKNGWTYNEYAVSVSKACTSSTGNGDVWGTTCSRGSIRMYSTEKKAYEALLHAMSERFASDLRKVEKTMERL